MQKQKFIVGELVAVVCEQAPEWNTPSVEIIRAEYVGSTNLRTGEFSIGWRYKTAHQPESAHNLRFREESLRKLPKQGDSFEEMMAKLNLGVPACQ